RRPVPGGLGGPAAHLRGGARPRPRQGGHRRQRARPGRRFRHAAASAGRALAPVVPAGVRSCRRDVDDPGERRRPAARPVPRPRVSRPLGAAPGAARRARSLRRDPAPSRGALLAARHGARRRRQRLGHDGGLFRGTAGGPVAAASRKPRPHRQVRGAARRRFREAGRAHRAAGPGRQRRVRRRARPVGAGPPRSGARRAVAAGADRPGRRGWNASTAWRRCRGAECEGDPPPGRHRRPGGIAALHDRHATRLLLLLLGTDAVLVALHVVYYLTPYLDARFDLGQEGGWPECFGYLKYLTIAILFESVRRATRCHGYFAWTLVFVVLLADDALQVHETLGRLIAGHLGIEPPFNLRRQDLGELAAAAVLGEIGRASCREEWG